MSELLLPRQASERYSFEKLVHALRVVFAGNHAGCNLSGMGFTLEYLIKKLSCKIVPSPFRSF